jgi:hypothetical protein
LKLNRDKDYAELALNPLNPLHISCFRGFIPCSGTTADWANLISQLEALKSAVPSDDAPSKVRREFVIQIQQIWWNAIGVDPTWFELNRDEPTALSNYLYAQ